MKKIRLYLFFPFYLFISSAVGQNWQWAKSAAGSLSEDGRSVCCDQMGFIYIGGQYNSPTLSFGSVILNCNTSSAIYFAKYDPTITGEAEAGFAEEQPARNNLADGDNREGVQKDTSPSLSKLSLSTKENLTVDIENNC